MRSNKKESRFQISKYGNYSILEEIPPESERKIERELGRKEGKRAIAKNMLRQESFDFDLVKDITGLDTDDRLDLINEIKQEGE